MSNQLKALKQLEINKILCLNLKGWSLKPSPNDNDIYDAFGSTPKGFRCWVEMKFRNDYWTTKLLEAKKYNALMSLVGKKFYYVSDLQGQYLFRLDALKMPPIVQRYCPATTMWDNKKILKDVYLLEESQAIKIIWHK
jgi:hypothetical protein